MSHGHLAIHQPSRASHQFHTIAQCLKFQLNLYELIKPYTFMSMVANLLYKKWFGPYYTKSLITGVDL